MKLVKMSLAAAMLMGASAFAVDNVKIGGDAQVFYNTNDADYMGYEAIKQDGSLFNKDSSAADAALHLNVSADLTEGVSAGASYTAISTLGLENNFVSNVWAGSHTATVPTGATYGNILGGAKVENASWFNEAWVAVTLGKTTAKVGRMNLDTPLAFTETWSIESNSFEGAVLLNQNIPDTTLVAAWVGNGNGTETFGQDKQSEVQTLGLAVGPVVNANGAFTTYGTNGAYAYGIVNNSIKPLTLQAWYYDVVRLAQAYWLEADLAMDNGILAGAQYTSTDYGDLGLKDNDVYALMLGFAVKDVATIKASFSQTGKNDYGMPVGFNTATSSGASKLYTEAWWNYGYVVRNDTTAWNITATGTVAGIDLGAYYTNSTSKDGFSATEDLEMNEFTFTAGKSFGPLDATLAYIYTQADDQNQETAADKGDAYNTIQAYLTLNF
jgi:imipenem/basic amino acid-specific outer membrane pore